MVFFFLNFFTFDFSIITKTCTWVTQGFVVHTRKRNHFKITWWNSVLPHWVILRTYHLLPVNGKQLINSSMLHCVTRILTKWIWLASRNNITSQSLFNLNLGKKFHLKLLDTSKNCTSILTKWFFQWGYFCKSHSDICWARPPNHALWAKIIDLCKKSPLPPKILEMVLKLIYNLTLHPSSFI